MDYQLLIKDSPNPVVILNVDEGHFVECNNKALDFFHLTKEEILKKSPYELSPANIYGHEAEAYSRQVIQEALAGANPVFDWIHIDKEGNEIPCEVRLIRFPPFTKSLVRGTIIDKRTDAQFILRESEERLRLTLDSARLGSFDWYPKENRLTWDDHLFSIFELDPNTSIDLNKHFFEIIHPGDKERVEREFQKSMAKNGPTTNEIKYRVILNGTVKHLLAHSRMIRDDSGELIRMLGTTQDFTELRESEEKLRQSENLFRSIVQDQEEMIVRWKPGGIRTFANRAYCEKFSLTEEEVIGSSFFELIDEKDQKEVIHKLESLTPKNPTATKIHRVKLPDGSTGWQEWTDRVLFNENGEVIEYQSTGRDITEIVKAREKLEESERRYRNVFNQQFQFSALLDLDCKITHINELALKTQGVFEDEFIGKLFWDVPGWKGNAEMQRKVKQQLDKLKRDEQPLFVEDQFKDPMGNMHYAQSHYSLIRNSNGEIENILVQAMDITVQKRAGQELELNAKKLSSIFNASTDIMLLLKLEDNGYVVDEINEASLRLNKFFGANLSREDYLGMSSEVLFREVMKLDQTEIDNRHQKYLEVIKSRKPIHYQQEIERNGAVLVTDILLQPIFKEHEVSHLLVSARDITEETLSRRKLESAYEEVAKLKAQLEQENIYLREEIRQEHDVENMVFKSTAFRKVLNQVEQVAKTGATVLITGETGTGKELIARAIHNISKRSEKPMIKVNAAAIPKDLIESELFGFEKGAFTGATVEKPGKFELADGGTIFLDEIGDMPIDLQVKILRVLQEGEVERLGST